MPAGVLSEAYARLHRSGPEWGEDQLTNHGPMAVEVMIRRGYAAQVDRWVDRYRSRLDDLPGSTSAIGERDWPEALGDGRRVADWTAYFTRQLAAAPWRDVLATWWPRLLPGVLAGTTHGVIRVGHAVRALLAGAENPETLHELAHGLAFWAARYQSVPASAHPAGHLDPGTALDALGRIPVQNGRVAERLGQLGDLPGWPAGVAALRPATGPEQVSARLADLVTAATVRYLAHGHASPVLLVHTATAPNAVLHTLPALPRDLWVPSLTAMWTTAAAITAAYAPPAGPMTSRVTDVPEGPDAAADVVDRAMRHGDEHVIKFTDTAAEVYTRTGNRDALAAAVHITTLIDPVG
ncbi:questin oxidase family protein [Micromonospora costi]|uniref:DUF4243 domain-containing protein n=1 Tax=Micromonospora costi TaxID=1530042 RepID=A0A3B0AJD4_9ACTN|nr:questin oxidase family protein [Micromonospora costi]RKN59046.1 DUF4243 domain-containing protein [Micromonospora costi]